LFILYRPFFRLKIFSGRCKCREGCAFVKDPIGCFEIYSQGPCSEHQFVQISKDNREGFCECFPGAIPVEGYEGCFYPYTRGPCEKGKEVHPDNGIGICSVNIFGFH